MSTATAKSTILERGEARFWGGKKLPDHLHDSDQQITPGLVERLRKYSTKVLEDAGFTISAWACEVYTMDGNLPRSQRMYTVEFTNDRGGMVGVQGIMTTSGWPMCDHGVCADIKDR